MEQINLTHAIYGKYGLTEEDIDSIMELISKRCNPRTKYALRAALENIQHKKHCDIYERIVKVPKIGRWQYIAGQSYPDEIRNVRELLRGW